MENYRKCFQKFYNIITKTAVIDKILIMMDSELIALESPMSMFSSPE